MTTDNETARLEAGQLVRQAVNDGRRPNYDEIGQQIGVSSRTVRRWTADIRPVRNGNGHVKTDIAPVKTDNGRPVTVDRAAVNGHKPDSRPARPVRPAVTARNVRRPSLNLWVAWPVAVTVALLSASHIIDLAIAAGHGWRAWLSPVALDGLAVAALLAWSAGRHRFVAAIGIAAGVAGSVAANVLAVRPELVDMADVSAVLAAFPPVALAVVIHLVRQ